MALVSSNRFQCDVSQKLKNVALECWTQVRQEQYLKCVFAHTSVWPFWPFLNESGLIQMLSCMFFCTSFQMQIYEEGR